MWGGATGQHNGRREQDTGKGSEFAVENLRRAEGRDSTLPKDSCPRAQNSHAELCKMWHHGMLSAWVTAFRAGAKGARDDAM